MPKSNQWAETHKMADYFEPLMRAKFVKAMKALRKSLTVTHVIMTMGKHKDVQIISRAQLEAALQPVAKVCRDAVRQGGKIGASKVNKALNK